MLDDLPPSGPEATDVSSIIRRGRQIRRRRRLLFISPTVAVLVALALVVAARSPSDASKVKTDTSTAQQSDQRTAGPQVVSTATGAVTSQPGTGSTASAVPGPAPTPDSSAVSTDSSVAPRVAPLMVFERGAAGGNGEIDVLRPGASSPDVLVPAGPTTSSTHPSLSRDGKHIAFASTQGNHFGSIRSYFDIWTMDADGSNQRQLTFTSPLQPGQPNANGADFPSWSPDGGRLAFTKPDGRGVSRLFLMNADGSNQRELTSDVAGAFNLSWSPSGDQIAFYTYGAVQAPTGNVQLWLFDLRTNAARQLHPAVASLTQTESPAWTPDGTSLLVQSSRTDGAADTAILAVDSGAITPIPLPSPAYSPTFCGSSTQVVVHTVSSTPYVGNVDELVGLDGSNPRPLVATPDGLLDTYFSCGPP